MKNNSEVSFLGRCRKFFADAGAWFNFGHIPLQYLVHPANLIVILPAAALTLSSKAYGIFFPNHEPNTKLGKFFKDRNFGFIPLAVAQISIAAAASYRLVLALKNQEADLPKSGASIAANLSFTLGNISLFLHYFPGAARLQQWMKATKIRQIATMPDLLLMPAYIGTAYLTGGSLGLVAGIAAAAPLVPAAYLAVRNAVRGEELKGDHLPNVHVNDLFATSATLSLAFAVAGGNPLGIAAQGLFVVGNICKSAMVRGIRRNAGFPQTNVVFSAFAGRGNDTANEQPRTKSTSRLEGPRSSNLSPAPPKPPSSRPGFVGLGRPLMPTNPELRARHR